MTVPNFQCPWCREYLAPRKWWHLFGVLVHPDGRTACPNLAARAAELRVEVERLRAQANCGEGHDPERICCSHARDVKRLRAQRQALLDACDENERHIRANVPHLPPDGGSFSVHVIRRYLGATAE